MNSSSSCLSVIPSSSQSRAALRRCPRAPGWDFVGMSPPLLGEPRPYPILVKNRPPRHRFSVGLDGLILAEKLPWRVPTSSGGGRGRKDDGKTLACGGPPHLRGQSNSTNSLRPHRPRYPPALLLPGGAAPASMSPSFCYPRPVNGYFEAIG